MEDPLEQVLKLVADGRLTAEEAAPILDALEARAGDGRHRGQADPVHEAGPRFARVEVIKDGRAVVNLLVPVSLGQVAMSSIPGLSTNHLSQVKEAISRGLRGPVVDINDGSDGVRIVIE
jgi:hypothetical protein